MAGRQGHQPCATSVTTGQWKPMSAFIWPEADDRSGTCHLILRLVAGGCDQQEPGTSSQDKGTARTCHLRTPSWSLWACRCSCSYLVSPSVVAFINSNNTVSKVSQSVEAVGPLLQRPKSYILMVRDPGKQCENGLLIPRDPSAHRPALCSGPISGSRTSTEKQWQLRNTPRTPPHPRQERRRDSSSEFLTEWNSVSWGKALSTVFREILPLLSQLSWSDVVQKSS